MSDFRRHYAVFFDETGPDAATQRSRAKWARVTSKRAAIRAARRVAGYVLTVGYGSRDAWDAPTFKVCGDIVADFRPEGGRS